MKNGKQKIEMMAVCDLVPYKANAKTHPDKQIKKIAASIKEFGFNVPLVIDGKNEIVAGHGRYLAANELGFEKVPCIRLEHLTPNQVRAYRIADNKISETEWNVEFLKLELGELKKEDFNIEFTGFNELEISRLLRPDTENEEKDEIPKPPAVPKTKVGNLWLMGKHRLLCGDATDEKCVRRLMLKERAGLMNTDPPYGVSYANDERPNPGVAKPRVAKDEMRDQELQTFLEAVF